MSAPVLQLNNPPPRARARERLIIVEFRGFRRAPSPQGMFRECSDSAHRLHSRKPFPWRLTGTYVARHVERPGCGRRTYTSRSRLRTFNRCAARDWSLTNLPRARVRVRVKGLVVIEILEVFGVLGPASMLTKMSAFCISAGPKKPLTLRVTSNAQGYGRRTHTSPW